MCLLYQLFNKVFSFRESKQTSEIRPDSIKHKMSHNASNYGEEFSPECKVRRCFWLLLKGREVLCQNNQVVQLEIAISFPPYV